MAGRDFQIGALFDSLPYEFIGCGLSVDGASLAVFGGSEQEAIVALKFEPANVLDSSTAWVGVALDVVGNGLFFEIDGVGAVIGEVAIESCGFLFLCAGAESGGEGLAIAFDCDLDAHPA